MNDTLAKLYQTILERKQAGGNNSYVASLFAKGSATIAKKLGEEATETVIAAAQRDRDAVVRESADLLFHLLVLWAEQGVTPKEVEAELQRREGTSGLEEKAGRKV